MRWKTAEISVWNLGYNVSWKSTFRREFLDLSRVRKKYGVHGSFRKKFANNITIMFLIQEDICQNRIQYHCAQDFMTMYQRRVSFKSCKAFSLKRFRGDVCINRQANIKPWCLCKLREQRHGPILGPFYLIYPDAGPFFLLWELLPRFSHIHIKSHRHFTRGRKPLTQGHLKCAFKSVQSLNTTVTRAS